MDIVNNGPVRYYRGLLAQPKSQQGTSNTPRTPPKTPLTSTEPCQAIVNVNGLELNISDFQFHKDNKTPEYLSKFRIGKVPGFECADGSLLVESDAIAQYIVESGPYTQRLLGSTPLKRASLRNG